MRLSNTLLILVLVGVLVSAIYQQYHGQGLPCPYCWLQRMGMLGMATTLLLNLRFGIQIKHYAIALLFAFTGGAVALRQISFHVCPNFSVFGKPVFGLSLYTWSFIVFCCAAVALCIFLFFYKESQKKVKKMHLLDQLAFFGLLLVTAADCGLLYEQCGFGRCKDVEWPQPNLRADR